MRRAQRLDPWLRAFIDIVEPGSGSAPAPPQRSPLAGLPIAVKGPHGTTTAQTRRLVSAGAVPIGITSLPRGPGYQTWGFTERGPTRNPWRPDLSPGGSSAGSAAAVAAGIVDLATGSDGAGSIRIPAAWCGIYGLKPTGGFSAGRLPAVPGPLVRDPRLLAAWAGAVLGPLPTAAPPVTIGWSTDLGIADAEVDPAVAALAHQAARELAARAGLTWRDAAVRLADPQHAWETYRADSPGRVAQARADGIRATNDHRLRAVFERVDLLATPTTPRAAHGHDGPGQHQSVALTWGFNLSGHPAMSTPAGRTREGAPVGLQLVARPGGDGTLLALAARHCPVAPVAPAPDDALLLTR